MQGTGQEPKAESRGMQGTGQESKAADHDRQETEQPPEVNGIAGGKLRCVGLQAGGLTANRGT